MYDNNGQVSRFIPFPFQLMLALIGIIAGSYVVLHIKNQGNSLAQEEGDYITSITTSAKNKAITTINNMQ